MNVISYIRYFYDCFLSYSRIIKATRTGIALAPGLYCISKNSRCYLYRYDTPVTFLKMIGVDLSKPSLYCYYQHKKKYDTSYKTQVVMTTNDGARFFNYKEKTTLHFFHNNSEYVQYKKAREYFAPPFKITTLHINKAYCIEKVIHHIPRREWNDEEIINRYFALFNIYIEYLKKLQKEEQEVLKMVHVSTNTSKEYIRLTKLLSQEIGLFKKSKYVYSHGDLHFDNVLFANEGFYILDFEAAGKNVFFYDVFNLMYVEFIDRNNDYFIKAYLSKESMMMDCFERMFNVVDEVFDYSLLHNYLKLYLLERLSRSVSFLECNTNELNLPQMIQNNVNKIYRVINIIKEYEV